MSDKVDCPLCGEYHDLFRGNGVAWFICANIPFIETVEVSREQATLAWEMMMKKNTSLETLLNGLGFK